MTMLPRPARFATQCALAALLLLATPGLMPTPASAHDPMPNISEIVHPLLPAIVNISVWAPADADTPRDALGRRPDRAHFFGSGFVINPSGVIVTNKHVINNAYQITVHFTDGTRARARVLATGGSVDIAVLKVSVPHELPALAWGDSDAMRIGDPVLAIGDPLGLGMSVSAGIVSALNRNINDSPYDDYIQTDAAINHGNSGGPLVNLQGEVVGIDTSLYTAPNGGSIGLGFAITSKDAKFVVDRLLRYGEVRAGWIGVALQDVTPDVVDSFGLSSPTGAIVAKVNANSPAAKAGMQDGDIITTMNGTVFSDARALMRMIGRTMIGDTVSLGIRRGGQEMNVLVTVGAYPSDGPSEATTTAAAVMRLDLSDFGMKLTRPTPALRTKFGLGAQTDGLLIESVTPNSVAAQHGLAGGDVLLRVQDSAMTTHKDFETALQTARAQGRRYVEMLIRSGSDQRWVGFVLSDLPQ